MLDTPGQTVSPVRQYHGEPAVRIRVNDGAETSPAGDENRRVGHWTAIRSAESPLDRTSVQLRRQTALEKGHSRQQKTEPDRRETTAAIAVPRSG